MARSNKNSSSSSLLKLRETLGILLILISLFVFVSLIYHSPGDYSSAVFPGNEEIQNKAGTVGAFISYELLFSFGFGAYLLTGLVFLFGTLVFLRINVPNLVIKLFSFGVFFVSLLTLLTLITPDSFGKQEPRTMIGWGGLYGHACVEFMKPRIGRIGLYITVLLGHVFSFMLGTDLLIYPFLRKCFRAAGGKFVDSKKIAEYLAIFAGRTMKLLFRFLVLPFRGLKWAGKHSYSLTRTGLLRLKHKTEELVEARKREWQEMIEARQKKQEEQNTGTEPPSTDPEQDSDPASLEEPETNTATKTKPAEQQKTTEDHSTSTQDPSETPNDSASSEEPDEKPSVEPGKPLVSPAGDHEYELPAADILEDPPESKKEKNLEMIEENKQIIEETLENFGIEGEVVGSSTGPVVTMYELELAPGVKVSKLINRSDDLAIALKAANVRIVFPIPGKSTVGIEIPNAYQGIVRLKEIIREESDAGRNMHVPMLLGRSAEGNPVSIDLAEMPHLLIAGTTGSGKSICLKNIVVNQLLFKTPSELKLVLIDPKMVELSRFQNIPHLVCPIIRDMKKVTRTFEWLVDYMEQRYKLLQLTGVKDIEEFNALDPEEAKQRIRKRGKDPDVYQGTLPRIVVVVDELADLMMVASQEVENTVTRIAQKARAVGIHMILSTQRPSSDVLTGLIKSNMPARISFKVMSGVNSRIIIDQNGAEDLIGDGDMLISLPDEEQPLRAQGVLVSEDEIDYVTDHWQQQTDEKRSSTLPEVPTIEDAKSAREAEMKENLEDEMDDESDADPDEGSADADSSDDQEEKERDDLFIDAIDVIVSEDRGSVSLIQRKLGIGYTRAARIMEQIADEGIVGPHRGNKPRKVLIDEDEWTALKEDGQLL